MMARKDRHNKPTLIPSITAAAVTATRERMRNDKDMGIYIKKRICHIKYFFGYLLHFIFAVFRKQSLCILLLPAVCFNAGDTPQLYAEITEQI